MKGAGKLDCSIDTRYETGIIFCNDHGKKSNIVTTIIVAAIVFVACVLMFSLKFEIKDVGSIPLLQLIVFNPYVIITAFVIAIIIAAVRRK